MLRGPEARGTPVPLDYALDGWLGTEVSFPDNEHSVGVEIVIGCLEDNGNVDLQQRLAQRVGLLHVPNLHLAHTPLRIRKSCCEIVFTAERYTRPFRAIRRMNPASNLTS